MRATDTTTLSSPICKVPKTPHPVPTADEISPVARPHGQAPNLNLNHNRNLARLRFLEIKSKITIKSGRKPFRLNSMAVHPVPPPSDGGLQPGRRELRRSHHL